MIISNFNFNWNTNEIENQNLTPINSTYCFDIHNHQTTKFDNEPPFAATGDRIKKLLGPDMDTKIKKEELIYCGIREDLKGIFHK